MANKSDRVNYNTPSRPSQATTVPPGCQTTLIELLHPHPPQGLAAGIEGEIERYPVQQASVTHLDEIGEFFRPALYLRNRARMSSLISAGILLQRWRMARLLSRSRDLAPAVQLHDLAVAGRSRIERDLAADLFADLGHLFGRLAGDDEDAAGQSEVAALHGPDFARPSCTLGMICSRK